MKAKKLLLTGLVLLISHVAFAANESVEQWVGMAPANWKAYTSAAPENNVAVQASQSTLLSVCFTNQTTNDYTLLVFNSTTVPADGAVVPILCGPVPKATATLVNVGCYTPPASINFPTGLSVAISTGPNCYLKASPGSPSGMFTILFK